MPPLLGDSEAASGSLPTTPDLGFAGFFFPPLKPMLGMGVPFIPALMPVPTLSRCPGRGGRSPV